MRFGSFSRGRCHANYDFRDGEGTTSGVRFADELGFPVERSLVGRESISCPEGSLSFQVIEERMPGRTDRYLVFVGASDSIAFRFAFPSALVEALLPGLQKTLSRLNKDS